MITASRQFRSHAPSLRRFARWVLQALNVRRERNALATMPADRLADIGLTPSDVARELARPVWDAPLGWRNP